jgi:hypothetical protein
MTSFIQAMTTNNAVSLSNPDPTWQNNGRISLFFKSARGLEEELLHHYMSKSSEESIVDTFLIAFYIRDCRGGKGERVLGRSALLWLFVNYPVQFLKVLKFIPEYGRWDDVLQFFPNVYSASDDIDRCNVQIKMVELFVEKIKEDYNLMLEGKPCSLCAKWAPTQKDSLDRKYGVFDTIANKMGITPRTLRKKYITPLRQYLHIVETFMSSNKWEEIDYNKVPSCAMKRLKDAFTKHDDFRFQDWKTALSVGDPTVAKVCGKQLFPYELVREIRTKHKADEVCEAQWKVLEEECIKNGALNSDVAVVDTSSSMHTPNFLPLDVAVSMGLLISGCSEGNFKNLVFTFNDVPTFVVIKEGSLESRYNEISRISWSGSTNIQATFELLLERGKKFSLRQDDMPKRLWIISDMQFNQVTGNKHLTNFQEIERMYKDSGYTRPQIIFWNVNGESLDFPVTSDQNGTVMISGFSSSIMKTILSGKYTDFSPFSILQETLNSDRLLPVRLELNCKLSL